MCRPPPNSVCRSILHCLNRHHSWFYRLSNLHNSLPRRSGLRLLVNQALVQTASTHDEIEHLQLSPAEVNKWLSEWEISDEDKSTYLKSLVDVYAKAEPYVFLLECRSSY